MYKEYFGLKEKPFSIAPNPHYFYMSEGHREALAHLLYGVKGEGGFVLLTGEVGTGKTTVCRLLLELIPEDLEIAFILNPPLTVEELVATVCDEFKISYPSDTRSVKDFVARIHAYLLDVHARGRRALLIIEEAQNLSTEVLEQIRLLTNLETDEHKLLQIIMLGQPELRDNLKQPQLRQLSQRITARYHLGPLSRKEVSEYVNYRLSTAGLVRPHRLFPERTLGKLFRLTRGVPRLINVICDRALLGAYVEGKDRVDTKTLTTAAREVSGGADYQWRNRKVHQGISVCFLLLLCAVAAATYYLLRPEPLARVTVKAVVEGRGTEANATSLKGPPIEKPMDTTPRRDTKATAYRTLFEQWQIEYKPESSRTACEQAVGQGLRCMHGSKGTISGLRQMNRPAALRLLDEKNGEYYATLTALHGETATVAIAADTSALDVKEITPPWTGDYLVLWRVPSDYKEKLKPGRGGPPVAWLDRQLALVQARTARAGRGQVYDEEMVKQVKEFQRTAGLTPDGIAGLRTIMALIAAAGDGGPTLHDGKAGN